MYVVRQPLWRNDLIVWAKEVRGHSFEWGSTDCAALGCEALRVQFGRDVVELPRWYSAHGAYATWLPFSRNGGPEGLLERLGGREIPVRTSGRYPLGAILVLFRNPEVDDMRFPAFGISLGLFAVQSNIELGVYWILEPEVKSAWLIERAVING